MSISLMSHLGHVYKDLRFVVVVGQTQPFGNLLFLASREGQTL